MEQAFDLLPRLLATLDAARRQSAATLDGWRDAAELRRDAARADALAWAEADDDVVEESQRFVGLRARWWLDGARWALARWRDATGPRARVAAEDRAALTAEAGPR